MRVESATGTEENRGSFDASGMHWDFWTTTIDQRAVTEKSPFLDIREAALIADGLVTRPFYEIKLVEKFMRYSATIRLQYNAKLKRVTMNSCEFRSGDLKVSDFHKIPIEKTIQAFNPNLFGYYISGRQGTVVYGPLSQGSQLLDTISNLGIRTAGPSSESLSWVNRVCAIAEMNRLPPTKNVSEVIGLPLRTASYWVKLMRERVKPLLKPGAVIKPDHELYLPFERDADSVFLGDADPASALE